MGSTHFNEDLKASENLFLSDASVGQDSKFDRSFREKVKEFVANNTQSVSPKQRADFSVANKSRLSLSVNIDDRSLSVVPLPISGFGDKVIYLRCFAVPILTQATERSGKSLKALVKEALPAFVGQLLRMDLPEELQDSRFGVAALHGSDVMRLLHSRIRNDDPLAAVCCLLTEFVKVDPAEAVGTSDELHRKLSGRLGAIYVDQVGNKTRLGQILGQLEVSPCNGVSAQVIERVQYGEHRNYTNRWQILTGDSCHS